MTPLATLLTLAALGIALLILWRVEPALARMNGKTHWTIRYALLLIAGGALGTLVTIITGGHIDPIALFTLAGIALLLLCERRIDHLIHIRKGSRHA